jgi:hypothetical protein
VKTVIFFLQGGIGKHIAATAVAQNINKNYKDRKLIIVCSYPEIFLNNPFVYRVYRTTSCQYFYEDFIKDKDAIFLGTEVYNSHQYVVENKHLIESWCNMFNLIYNGENPSLFVNIAEFNDIKSRFYKEKPILIFQPQGGPENNNIYHWSRDIPQDFALELVNNLKHKYHIYHIKRPEHPTYAGVEPLSLNVREMLALFLLSSKRLLIDSFAQHACAALNLQSTVLWIGTSPNKLGYNIHNNILPKKESRFFTHNLEGIIMDKEFTGIPHQCDIDLNNLFNVEDILKNF